MSLFGHGLWRAVTDGSCGSHVTRCAPLSRALLLALNPLTYTSHLTLFGQIFPHFAIRCLICCLVADARKRRLRSTASRTCVVTRTYSTFGDRAFGAAGPGLWNSLPSHLKDADISYSEFRRSLKTFLFGQWGHGAV